MAIQTIKTKQNELNDKIKDEIILYLKKEFTDIKDSEFVAAFDDKLTLTNMKKIAAKVTAENRVDYFFMAKDFVELSDYSKDQIEKLAELGKALKLKSSETGFDFDIYSLNAINQFEFHKTLQNFSMIAAAIGFLPILPISDFAISKINAPELFLLATLNIAFDKSFNVIISIKSTGPL